jgi:hypothetical protein
VPFRGGAREVILDRGFHCWRELRFRCCEFIIATWQLREGWARFLPGGVSLPYRSIGMRGKNFQKFWKIRNLATAANGSAHALASHSLPTPSAEEKVTNIRVEFATGKTPEFSVDFPLNSLIALALKLCP